MLTLLLRNTSPSARDLKVHASGLENKLHLLVERCYVELDVLGESFVHVMAFKKAGLGKRNVRTGKSRGGDASV